MDMNIINGLQTAIQKPAQGMSNQRSASPSQGKLEQPSQTDEQKKLEQPSQTDEPKKDPANLDQNDFCVIS